MYTIAALVAAYNEEKTIGHVIEILNKIEVVDKVIVVSDGSTDQTADIASEYSDLTLVEIEKNIGKGAAIMRGLESCEGCDIIILLDADLVGLREEHINALLGPILNEGMDMTIGQFSGGRVGTDLAQKITPFLSGQRAMKRSLLERIPNKDINRYGVEAAITRYVNSNNIKYKSVKLKDLTHRTKEEKLGVLRGFKERVKMYRDVIKAMKK